MTPHEITVAKIRDHWRKAFGVPLHSRAFRETIWRAYREWALDPGGGGAKNVPEARESFDQDFPQVGFRPDLFSVQRTRRRIVVTAIEVEDTSRINEFKLEALATAWFYADCSAALEFRCWVCDRYGNNWHKLDLLTAYLEAA